MPLRTGRSRWSRERNGGKIDPQESSEKKAGDLLERGGGKGTHLTEFGARNLRTREEGRTKKDRAVSVENLPVPLCMVEQKPGKRTKEGLFRDA